MKFRKKPVVIEATQWFRNGDHPLDHAPFECLAGQPTEQDQNRYNHYLQTEGKVVRYYNRGCMLDETLCKHCDKRMYDHGWIDTLEGGHVVCPGDWIITGVKGEVYPCKPEIFEMTYEKEET